jgi:hypothetical protein
MPSAIMDIKSFCSSGMVLLARLLANGYCGEFEKSLTLPICVLFHRGEVVQAVFSQGFAIGFIPKSSMMQCRNFNCLKFLGLLCKNYALLSKAYSLELYLPFWQSHCSLLIRFLSIMQLSFLKPLARSMMWRNSHL